MRGKRWLVAALGAGVLVSSSQTFSDPMRGRREYTEEEKREIQELERDVAEWEKAALEHESRTRAVLEREGERRMVEYKRRYRGLCVGANEEYKRRQEESLAVLQGFLKKYPDDERWTPDVMFRLADLYYDRAWEKFRELDDPACSQVTGAQGREVGDADNPDYTDAIETWKSIVRKFPAYRLVGAAVYMAAIFTADPRPFGMGDPTRAKPLYLGLVCRKRNGRDGFDPLAPVPPPPDPPPPCASPSPELLKADPYAGCEAMTSDPEIVDDGWYRIGDIHFNARCELPEAIAAFKRVVAREDSKVYDVALYKLAWSYYRFNQYQDAIQAFDKFVVRADQAAAEGKKGFAFRTEAVQYLGYSFADPWPGEALTDPVRALERLEAHYKPHMDDPSWRHVRDAYDALGDALKEYAGVPLEDTEPSPDLVVSYLTAVKAWSTAIEKWPYDACNPEVHRKILETLDSISDVPEAKRMIARFEAQITEMYKRPDSCQTSYNWYCANEATVVADPRLYCSQQMVRQGRTYRPMVAAAELGENALLKTAINLHAKAQEAQTAWEKGRSLDELAKVQSDAARKEYQETYKAAAGLYERFIDTYPTSRQMPVIMYYLGDCYFQMDDFDTAVEKYYDWIRARPSLVTAGLVDQKVYEDSVRRILESRQRAVKFALASGSLVEPPLIPGDQLDPSAQPLPMDPLYKKLLAAIEIYATHFPGDAKAAANEYDAGLIAYEHLMLDEALRRFTRVLKEFCKTDYAPKAKDWILAIYQARGDKIAFNRTVDDFVKRSCGKPDDLKAAQEQKSKYALFEAEELMKSGKLLEAAESMYALYRSTDRNPSDPTRSKALYFAGAFYMLAGRYKTSISLFEQYTREFDKFSEFYLEAKFGLALSYEKYFDYQNASRVYLEWIDLYDRHKNDPAKKWRTTDSFNPARSYLNAWMAAAEMREAEKILRDRGGEKGALTLWAEFERKALSAGDARAQEAAWHIAEIYEKLGEERRAREQYLYWRGKYAKNPEAPEIRIRYVKTFYKVAAVTKARKDWEAVIQAYRASGLFKADSEAAVPSEAAEWAGEAVFRIAEMNTEGFKKYQIRWNEKKLEKGDAAGMFAEGFGALRDEFEKAKNEYLKIAEFPASSWFVAALVRVGDLAMMARDKMINAPVPKLIKKLDRQLPDEGILGQFKLVLEQRADPEYKDATLWDADNAPEGAEPPDNVWTARYSWEKALDVSIKASYVTEYARLARERLNTYYRDLHPLNRDDIVESEDRP